LQHSATQQAASAYMNFLIRPDAEALLQEDDYRRLWEFFTNMMPRLGVEGSWLTQEVKAHYRAVWQQGLTGPLNYYRASPMRPATAHDTTINSLQLPEDMLHISVPTCVLWGMADIALPAGLLGGLEQYVPQLTVHRLEDATHWLVHEQPARVIELIDRYLRTGA
jgi:pimeloyl-ACP methyl ester carboxylesterase